MAATGSDSLITLEEADDIVSAPRGMAEQLRTPMLVILGVLVVVIATLLIMMLLSLRGSRTGWESILPFLNQKPTTDLQTD